MNERTIAIVGSREGINLDRVREFVGKLNPATTIVISGGARGVDECAVEAAKARGIRTRVYPAQWKEYGKSAGFRRNEILVREADDIAAFWDGKSKGTEHTISLAITARKPVAVFSPHGNLIKFIDEDGTVYERTEHSEGRQGSEEGVHPET